MKKPNYWTFEKCLESALNYNSKQEWRKNAKGAYLKSFRQGWLDACSAHMTRPKQHNYKWSLEECKLDAQKYTNRTEWARKSSGAYDAAATHSWTHECCEHMKYISGTSKAEQEILGLIKQSHKDAQSKYFTKDAIKYQLDVFIPSLNKGVEYNGTYWHGPALIKKGIDPGVYHNNKKTFFKKLGIEYIEIWEKDWKENKEQCLKAINMFLGVQSG